MIVVTLMCAAALHNSAAASPACRRGAFDCPMSLDLHQRKTLRGILTKRQSALSYSFDVAMKSELYWTYRGPSVNFIITTPAGDAEGPGITSPARFEAPGKYEFSLSSNTMAEHVYGKFVLMLDLKPLQ